jgi:outer membrane receptor protein involved in Fe transport
MVAQAQTPAASNQPTSSSAPDETVRISPFEVRAQTEDYTYRATESVSASGVALPLKELPVQIEVLTRSMLEDRGVSDMWSTNMGIPGVTSNGPVLTGQENWNIHGFFAPALRNGFRLDNDTTDASEIERVEVARGPNAVLYGSGATGGIVNRITKKAQFTPARTVSFGIGDYDYYAGMMDLTGPLPVFQMDGKPVLAYRLIAATRNNTSDVQWYKRTQNIFNGSLRFEPTSRLMMTLELSRVQRHGRPWVEITEGTDSHGAVAFNKDPTGRGYQFSIDGPDSYHNMRGDNAELETTLQLPANFTVNVGYVLHPSDMRMLRARRVDLWAQGKPAQLESQSESVSQRLGKANLLWDAKTAAVTNKAILGYERSSDNDPNLTFRISNWVVPPDFSITPAALTTLYTSKPTTNRNLTTYRSAYRFTDFATLLGGRLHVLAGFRHDNDIKIKDTVPGTYVTQAGANTYQFGAVYDLKKEVSIFASHSTDFVPNTQVSASGGPLDPQHNKGTVGGVKVTLFGGKLTGSASYFDEDHTNIPSRIGQTSTFELTGAARARGVDFNLVADVVENLMVSFGGSFFDAKTTSNPADRTQVGLPPQDVCPDSLDLQASYRFSQSLKGLSCGLGGYWHIDYPTESATAKRHERTDDQVILNGFLRYGLKVNNHPASVTLNVSNLTDKRGYIINQETFGPPRMINCSFKYEF